MCGEQEAIHPLGGAGRLPADTSSRALKIRTLTLTPRTNSRSLFSLPGPSTQLKRPFQVQRAGAVLSVGVRGAICGVSRTRAPLEVTGPEVTKYLGLKGCCGLQAAIKERGGLRQVEGGAAAHGARRRAEQGSLRPPRRQCSS